MKRRNLLRSLAMLPLAAADLITPFASAKAPHSWTRQRVRPSDPAWPKPADWAKLNQQVGGNLIEVRSLFGSCGTDPDGTACVDAQRNIGNPYWIADQPSGTEVSGWLDAWAPAPSAYAVKARNAADVAAAVTFARRRDLRLVIKGGSHSYLGTSNAPDSLLIWTRAMNKVTLHDGFVGKSCEGRTAPVPAVSAEAGAVWMDLYHAVTTEAGRYVQGGGCVTLGVAGLIQSGGFNSFSKQFGTAAAGLLEAEIVTADGSVRVVNECSHPDLFWAIKGGGGGTFGVITRVTLRTHDLPNFFGTASGIIKAQSDAAFQNLIARFIGFYHENLLNPHWGELVHLGSDNTLELSMVSQGLDGEAAAAIWQPFFDWVKSADAELTITSALRVHPWDPRDWWNIKKTPWFTQDARNGAPAYHGWETSDQREVGAFLHGFDSLWLPASLLQEGRRQQLADALFAASRHKLVRLHFNKGLAGAPGPVRAAALQTATNPAAVDAFALAIIADGEQAAYPGLARQPIDVDAARQSSRAIDRAAAELRKIAPDAGSYVSESNYFNSSWQSEYWGSNYTKLRAIKQAYDPSGLFFVHHGVGSEEWSADGFTRVVSFPAPNSQWFQKLA